jgi:poly(A) polymerase
MIRRFLGRVFSGKLFKSAQPKVIPFKTHRIASDHVSRCALKTCELLQQRGHPAYVVGGAVRDLLLGGIPKDYDVATGATPEEVRAIFRRSRIIGRRFRLVHVMCGAETIEVSTFRGVAGVEATDAGDHSTDEHGRILRDNVFGSMEDDARRRDFTVNAMFYDPVRGEVIDYHDGVADIKAKKLRMIGDPAQRYREDPIRMLRAVRLAAARGLEIETRTRKPIRELAGLLLNVPKARVFDEMMKLLLSGHVAEGVRRLRKEGLHHGVLPLLDVILEQPLGERFVMAALENTDKRINEGKTVSPGFLFASLLWHARHAYNACAVSRNGPGAAGAGGEARHSAPLWRRYERHLGIAGALSEPRRAPAVAAARSSAVSRRLRFPAVALREPRDRSRAGGVVGKVPACGRADDTAGAGKKRRRPRRKKKPAAAATESGG